MRKFVVGGLLIVLLLSVSADQQQVVGFLPFIGHRTDELPCERNGAWVGTAMSGDAQVTVNQIRERFAIECWYGFGIPVQISDQRRIIIITDYNDLMPWHLQRIQSWRKEYCQTVKHVLAFNEPDAHPWSPLISPQEAASQLKELQKLLPNCLFITPNVVDPYDTWLSDFIIAWHDKFPNERMPVSYFSFHYYGNPTTPSYAPSDYITAHCLKLDYASDQTGFDYHCDSNEIAVTEWSYAEEWPNPRYWYCEIARYWESIGMIHFAFTFYAHGGQTHQHSWMREDATSLNDMSALGNGFVDSIMAGDCTGQPAGQPGLIDSDRSAPTAYPPPAESFGIGGYP